MVESAIEIAYQKSGCLIFEKRKNMIEYAVKARVGREVETMDNEVFNFEFDGVFVGVQ